MPGAFETLQDQSQAIVSAWNDDAALIKAMNDYATTLNKFINVYSEDGKKNNTAALDKYNKELYYALDLSFRLAARTDNENIFTAAGRMKREISGILNTVDKQVYVTWDKAIKEALKQEQQQEELSPTTPSVEETAAPPAKTNPPISFRGKEAMGKVAGALSSHMVQAGKMAQAARRASRNTSPEEELKEIKNVAQAEAAIANVSKQVDGWFKRLMDWLKSLLSNKKSVTASASTPQSQAETMIALKSAAKQIKMVNDFMNNNTSLSKDEINGLQKKITELQEKMKGLLEKLKTGGNLTSEQIKSLEQEFDPILKQVQNAVETIAKKASTLNKGFKPELDPNAASAAAEIAKKVAKQAKDGPGSKKG